MTEGELVIVSGRDSLVQSIRRRLQTSRGEWRYDLSHGIPWLRTLGEKAPLGVIRSIVREALRETPGVLDVETVDLTRNSVTRTLTIAGRVLAEDGAPVTFAPVKIGSVDGDSI